MRPTSAGRDIEKAVVTGRLRPANPPPGARVGGADHRDCLLLLRELQKSHVVAHSHELGNGPFAPFRLGAVDDGVGCLPCLAVRGMILPVSQPKSGYQAQAAVQERVIHVLHRCWPEVGKVLPEVLHQLIGRRALHSHLAQMPNRMTQGVPVKHETMTAMMPWPNGGGKAPSSARDASRRSRPGRPFPGCS
jgi:hypothetical protein